jgi:hypothetical protein
MDDAEVVVLQLFVPPCGSAGQLLKGLPVHEILVVHLYHEGFLGPDKVRPPVVYRFDHSEEFEVVGIVILFGGGECGQVVSHWVAFSWGGRLWSLVLGEDSSYSVF